MNEESDELYERPASQVLVDRLRYLIRTDENLTVAECLGALYIVMHELAQCALDAAEDEEE